MNALIFVTWLYLQIVLVQCDIFVNNNLNGSRAPIKMCIQKAINHLFSQNDTLNLILNNDLCEDAIFEMNTMRPYIVLNMDQDNAINKFQYDGQFIICPKDIGSLNFEMYRTSGIALRNQRTMGISKYMVITNTTQVSTIFQMFWHYGINNVIILVYGKGTTKLVTCSRFAPENECGETAGLIIAQDCKEQLSLSFTNVIHQMNKCPITFQFSNDTIFSNYAHHPFALVVLHFFEELSHHLNATLEKNEVIALWDTNDLINNMENIVLSTSEFKQSYYKSLTEPIIISEILWMVPKAKEISNLNVCLQVFNYNVWIATSVVFICVTLTWFFVISRNGGFTFDKLCISFLNVWSLTICGNVARVPRSLALRILLLFYLFYAINMQFAFTSDMSTVLTAPRYEFQIRNLKELVDSQLPIYISEGSNLTFFKANNTDEKLYTKVKNLLHVVTDDQFIDHLLNLHANGNYAVLVAPEEICAVEIHYKKKIEAYAIKSDLIADVYTSRFAIIVDHYFTTTLNTFISRMTESGIQDQRKKDIYRQHNFHKEKIATMPEDDELTLKHITFIFKFLGFGLFTACVVFCFELVLHKYL